MTASSESGDSSSSQDGSAGSGTKDIKERLDSSRKLVQKRPLAIAYQYSDLKLHRMTDLEGVSIIPLSRLSVSGSESRCLRGLVVDALITLSVVSLS